MKRIGLTYCMQRSKKCISLNILTKIFCIGKLKPLYKLLLLLLLLKRNCNLNKYYLRRREAG